MKLTQINRLTKKVIQLRKEINELKRFDNFITNMQPPL